MFFLHSYSSCVAMHDMQKQDGMSHSFMLLDVLLTVFCDFQETMQETQISRIAMQSNLLLVMAVFA